MRRNEIDPPGVFVFNRHMLYPRLQYHVFPHHQTLFLNGGPDPMSNRHPCPSSEISENLGPYPVKEVQAARCGLIDELYLAPNCGRMMLHRIWELSGILPRRDGVVVPAQMVPGRVTYCEQSNTQLSDPQPSLPSASSSDNDLDGDSSDSDSDGDSVQEVEENESSTRNSNSNSVHSRQEVQDKTLIGFSSQIKRRHVDDSDSSINMPSTSNFKRNRTDDKVILIE